MKQWLENKLIELEAHISSLPRYDKSLDYFVGQKYIVLELLEFIKNN
jgi:hypothetical protein